uniref:SET domain containing 4 n=1 Tax=Cynoglossus semilaevis TaxID=244447 RepID=A0A3P8WQF1_CYNSE
YVRLMKFLHQQQFTSTPLQPVLFTGNNSLNPLLVLWQKLFDIERKPRCSALLALCVFLLCERHRGEASDWFSYINVLPKSYTCPVYFTDDVMAVLPASLQRQAFVQRETLQELYSSKIMNHLLLYLFLSGHPSRWAWCSVNTRSVFMAHPSNDFLSGEDVYALVKAGFNDVTGCYEIRSIPGIRRYQQAFINYGSHDNQRLLLEYGFVAPGNPHSVVYVDEGKTLNDKSLKQKMKFLRENNLLQNLTISSDGPSWRLMTALRLFSMPQTLYHQWKSVLLGQAICEEMEEWSVSMAERLCQQILRGTTTSLYKVCTCTCLQSSKMIYSLFSL